MKTSIKFSVLASLALVLAQNEAGPSPTQSYGCEPHGDHWHCEGAVTATITTPVAVITSSGAAPVISSVTLTSTHTHDDHDDDHDHDHSAGATESLAPSPTASIGCEPHGDHWHCDGPRPAVTTPLTSVAATRVIANSTTTRQTSSSIAPSVSAPSATLAPTGAASALAVGYGALAGVLGLFGFLAL